MHLTEQDFADATSTAHGGAHRECAFPCPRVRVTIEEDHHPEDPFEMHDGHWPMLVEDGGRRSSVTIKVECGREIPNSMGPSMQQWFTNEGLIHNQHDIARILGVDPNYMLDTFGCRHSNVPEEIWAMMDEYQADEGDFEKRAELYELAGVFCHVEQVRGHSQGDRAELLIIAPRETIINLRGKDVDEAAARKDMEAQAQLYEDWVFGSCYGYIIETLPPEVSLEDPDDSDWEQTEDGSCWGYIGDHDKSGILDQINEVLGYAPTRAMIADYTTGCLTGTHDWAANPEITDCNHACGRCGELYGKPEGVSDYLTEAAA